jgi:hypothetical protein
MFVALRISLNAIHFNRFAVNSPRNGARIRTIRVDLLDSRAGFASYGKGNSWSVAVATTSTKRPSVSMLYQFTVFGQPFAV